MFACSICSYIYELNCLAVCSQSEKEGSPPRVSVRATSLLTADRILIGYFPAPHALRARRFIRSSLRLAVFPSLINLRMYPFVQPGRTCTVFQPNTGPASSFFGTIAFSRFWRSYTIGEELNGSSASSLPLYD